MPSSGADTVVMCELFHITCWLTAMLFSIALAVASLTTKQSRGCRLRHTQLINMSDCAYRMVLTLLNMCEQTLSRALDM